MNKRLYTMGSIPVACAHLLALGSAANAEIAAEQLRLLDKTIAEIANSANGGRLDATAFGHISIRCSIISSTMAELLPKTLPDDADEATRANVSNIARTYSENADQFLDRAWGILEMPESQFIELQTGIFGYWAEETTQAAVQLFRKNPNGSEAARLGRSFKDELDICNFLDKQGG